MPLNYPEWWQALENITIKWTHKICCPENNDTVNISRIKTNNSRIYTETIKSSETISSSDELELHWQYKSEDVVISRAITQETLCEKRKELICYHMLKWARRISIRYKAVVTCNQIFYSYHP